MIRAIASAFVAVAMSLFTAFVVTCYWLLLALLTMLRMLLWPIRVLMKPAAEGRPE